MTQSVHDGRCPSEGLLIGLTSFAILAYQSLSQPNPQDRLSAFLKGTDFAKGNSTCRSKSRQHTLCESSDFGENHHGKISRPSSCRQILTQPFDMPVMPGISLAPSCRYFLQPFAPCEPTFDSQNSSVS